MKKYLSFIAFAMLAVFSLSFVSCSSDDDESPSKENSDFVGTWSVQYLAGYGETLDDEFDYMQMKSDGTYIEVQEDETAKNGYVVYHGKWSVSNDKLILHVTSGDLKGTTWTYDIIKKEKDKMTVAMWGVTVYLVRVNDDIIQKYL